jgi:lipopolysaccharide export system ATP-binding protein
LIRFDGGLARAGRIETGGSSDYHRPLDPSLEAGVFESIRALFMRHRVPARQRRPGSDRGRRNLAGAEEPIFDSNGEIALARPAERRVRRDGAGAMPRLDGYHDAAPGWGSDAISYDETRPARRDEDARRRVERSEYSPATASSAQAKRGPRARAAQRDVGGFLAVHGVEKSFGGRKVVKGTSLYVRRGEAVGLLGPNGAGKTTVFYMITGLISADRGNIELEGYDITRLPMYQRARLGIGYLPQEASIFRGLNVEDNIRAVLEVVEPNRKKRETELDALLEEFNIARLRKTPAIALSGGERRRVEIARALATRPSYMLLDEPFAGIDPIAVGDIQALVRHLTQRDIGVLITDHNVRETLGLTDRAYIIYSGEVLMEGRADDIVTNSEVRRLYLGEEFRM